LTWAQALEEIIVTAQKREESLQEVPMAIQAFTGEQIRNLRISRASDITRLAPNLNLSTQNTASRQINIRGVGTSDFFGNSAGSVAITMDEVTMSSSYLSSLGLYDLERVEILRGPQNSLFGRNTTGGAVNYISRLPEVGGESNGYVDVAFGNYNMIEVHAATSFNLGDSAAFRIAGKSYDRDGIWNDLGNSGAEHGEKDRKALRGTLVFEPSDATTVIVGFRWAEEDSDFDPIKAVGTRITNGSPDFGTQGPQPPAPFPLFSPIPAPIPVIDYNQIYDSFNAQGNNPSTNRWEDIYITGTYLHQVETNGLHLRIDHEFSFATFSSITAWDDTEVLWTYETGGIGNNSGTGVTTCTTCIPLNGMSFDGSPQVTLAIDQDQAYEQFSQEFRFVSSAEDDFRWIAGIYFFKEDSDLMQNVRFGAAAFDTSQPTLPYAPFFPGQPIGGFFGSFPLIGVPFGNRLAYHYAQLENDVWSPYAQIEYDFNDDLSMTFGIRFTSDEKTMPLSQVGNISTVADDILTVYTKEEVLPRGATNTLVCDLDGDGNNTFVDSGGSPTNTPDNRGLLCIEDLVRPDLNFEEWGGKIGLDWSINENVMLYGIISRGFRSGKHDIEFLHGPHTGWALEDLEPETLDAFEIGLKSSLADGSVQLNLAAYLYTWENQQTIFVSPQTGPAFVNIPESDLMGFEVELKWAPAEGWYISAGLGLMDTEIQSSSDTRFVQVGHALPFAAETSANLLVIKDIELGPNTLSLQADYQYRSDLKAYARDVIYMDELQDVNVINARVSYAFGADQKYEIAVFGENLTEDEGCHYKWDLTGISGTTYCVAREAAAFYGVQGRISF
jgi:iron complex outermembrane receptor protein